MKNFDRKGAFQFRLTSSCRELQGDEEFSKSFVFVLLGVLASIYAAGIAFTSLH